MRTLLADQPPHPDEWLTVEAQELLSDAVLTSPVDGWAAACLWKDRDLRDITEVVDGPEDAVRFRVFESERKPDGLRLSILTYEDARPGSGSFDSEAGPGYFCYLPNVGDRLSRAERAVSPHGESLTFRLGCARRQRAVRN